MFEQIVWLLIYIALVVAAAYLVLWVLGQLGIAPPQRVVQCLWVVVVLIVILLLWRTIGPALSSGHLPGLR